MYIIYTDKEYKSFGIWEISKDMSTQTCVYYSNEYPITVDELETHPIEDVVNQFFIDGCEVIDILTRDQVEELIFFNQ